MPAAWHKASEDGVEIYVTELQPSKSGGGNANLAFQGILSKAASICRELQMPELCSPKQSCVFTCVSADCANYFQIISKTRDHIYSSARLSAFWFFFMSGHAYVRLCV